MYTKVKGQLQKITKDPVDFMRDIYADLMIGNTGAFDDFIEDQREDLKEDFPDLQAIVDFMNSKSEYHKFFVHDEQLYYIRIDLEEELEDVLQINRDTLGEFTAIYDDMYYIEEFIEDNLF